MREHNGQVVDVTVPSPVNSPWVHVIPVCPKFVNTMVRSLTSTLPSRLASPGVAGVRRNAWGSRRSSFRSGTCRNH